ncbi:hypothetical protein AGR8A_Cc40668 [Agrobacterium fabrum str. J-07]|nr:hypothetical protein AGR8A_Cc40668 [Agrobacterium fabrum str. J-07]
MQHQASETGESGFVEDDATRAQLRRHYAVPGLVKHRRQRFSGRKARGICYNAREARRQALAGRAEEGERQ